jgi:hypothetical protein
MVSLTKSVSGLNTNRKRILEGRQKSLNHRSSLGATVAHYGQLGDIPSYDKFDTCGLKHIIYSSLTLSLNWLFFTLIFAIFLQQFRFDHYKGASGGENNFNRKLDFDFTLVVF